MSMYEPPGEIHTLAVPDDCHEMITFFNISGAMVYVDGDGAQIGYEDTPQGSRAFSTTRSPSARPVTPGPALSTHPEISCRASALLACVPVSSTRHAGRPSLGKQE
ncbi:hypothetical protein [Spongiactinospora sp. TRM90649]|uniref:hypothetical protein n=1 Tax=Spongiactinospora sp. TRM90649 TaxID=3031114 RepID=UPI0023F69EA8|nr:hypothetical protein [Spongiactinospora sp. TRM90649]MDF5758221.1 hypothetical protein [Spongiactinospora sp. TRM90649]